VNRRVVNGYYSIELTRAFAVLSLAGALRINVVCAACRVSDISYSLFLYALVRYARACARVVILFFL
jgi:hypothetical protein